MLGADGLGRYQQAGYAAVRHRVIKGATGDELGCECVTAGWTEIDADVRMERDRRVEGVETYESAGGRDEGVEAMVVFGTWASNMCCDGVPWLLQS